jgi:hypothetical protein
MMFGFMLLFTKGIQAQYIQTQVKQSRQLKNNLNPELIKPLNDNKFLHANRQLQGNEYIHHVNNLNTAKANQCKSALAGMQNPDSLISETYESTANHWSFSFKVKFYYDDNGNDTLEFVCNWDESTSRWITWFKAVSTYDDNGNMILKLMYLWDETNSQWITNIKSYYNYDANGNRTSYLSYIWDETSSKWWRWHKEESTYDDNGNKTLDIEYEWDETTSQWLNKVKYEYTYDANGNMTLNIGYNWDENTSQWIRASKEEPTYDANGNITLYIGYTWHEYTDQWTNSFTEEYTYDSNENMVLYIGYNWDENTSQWIAFEKTTFYFSEHNITLNPKIPEKEISVYPNPAEEFVVFDVPDISTSATIELFNVDGKKVLEQKLSENKQISVNNLGKGLYLFKLHDIENIYVGKITIK